MFTYKLTNNQSTVPDESGHDFAHSNNCVKCGYDIINFIFIKKSCDQVIMEKVLGSGE